MLSKEDLNSVQEIEGFPYGDIEDILALSELPNYTAFPNPFINRFINKYGKPYDYRNDNYKIESYSADVTEGKNDPIYSAHSYHTKIPYKAIMRYILHYTNPGDIVLDGFCGAGMTGVAAQLCGCPDEKLKSQIEKEMPGVQWGARKVILNDLSPAATFIAYNYNNYINTRDFELKAKKIIDKVEREYGWMYKTIHTIDEQIQYDLHGEPIHGTINYVIWSDVFVCNNCSQEIVFWEQAFSNTGKVNNLVKCLSCGAVIHKKSVKRKFESLYDAVLQKTISLAKQIPVLINYTVNNKRFEKKPDSYDLTVLDKINSLDPNFWVPVVKIPEGHNTKQPKNSHGITYIHHFFFKRNLLILGAFINNIDDKKSILNWLITSVCEGGSKLNRERPTGLPSKLPGTLYISSIVREVNLIKFIKRKIKKRIRINYKAQETNDYIITTQSVNDLSNIQDNSIDYIFTDPPFGDNLMYSELNLIWESWLKVRTNNKNEAIINKEQHKYLADYQRLMEGCFLEYYRVLKPGRWMTIIFHNSKNSVWNAIQEAIIKAGFMIVNVKILDKRQGSFKQVTTTSAVKKDLVISAYKHPKHKIKEKQLTKKGTKEGVWTFIHKHLEKLPVMVENDGKIGIVSERQKFSLYGAMLAFHIQNGLTIPMGASEFYKGLKQHFPERNGMYFLPEQIKFLE